MPAQIRAVTGGTQRMIFSAMGSRSSSSSSSSSWTGAGRGRRAGFSSAQRSAAGTARVGILRLLFRLRLLRLGPGAALGWVKSRVSWLARVS